MDAQRLARDYAKEHGRPPARIERVRLPGKPGWLVVLGPVVEMTLEHLGKDGRPRPKTVRFGAGRGPILARDDRGRMRFLEKIPAGRSADPSDPSAQAIARAYTALHEGQPPQYVRLVEPPPDPVGFVGLGRMTDVIYRKTTTDGAHLYHHPFKPHARPLIARDPQGGLHALWGRYTVNERGIVDAMQANPRRNPSRRRARRARAGYVYLANPTPPGSEAKTAKIKAKVSRKDQRKEGDRVSPSDFIYRAVVAAGSGALYTTVTTVALNQTGWSPSATGALQGILGILGGIALYQLAPNAGVGLVTAGAVATVFGGLKDYRVDGALRSLFAGPQPATPTAPGSGAKLHSITPGGGFSSAAGLPRGYAMTTMSGCVGAAHAR